MLIYDDVEQLVADMFHTVEVDEDVISVIADKQLVSNIMQEMLTYEDVSIDYCNIDAFAYDKEYFVSLHYDEDDECWYICVDQTYNEDKEKYNAMGGYVLFHEDVNSKALVGIQNNEMSFLTGHDWFVIGEDDSFVTDEEDGVDKDIADEEADMDETDEVSGRSVTNKTRFFVNEKEVDEETYDIESRKFDRLFYNIFDEMFVRHNRLVNFVYGYPRWFRI